MKNKPTNHTTIPYDTLSMTVKELKREVRRREQQLRNMTKAANDGQVTAKQRRAPYAHGAVSRAKKYGITQESYMELLEIQQHRCAICGDTMDKPCVDHSHTHGHVRGILCTRCNTGLGMFRDNVRFMERAIKYINVLDTPA